MPYKWPKAGIASQGEVEAEASAETKAAMKESSKVEALSTADIPAPKNVAAKSGKKKGK